MSVKEYPQDHPPVARHPRIGILLVNLGTPDDTGAESMRRYLQEFLSDRRVVEANRFVWWFVLNVIVLGLKNRPKKSGAAYDRIWLKPADDPAGDGSPLRKYTRLQAEKLARAASLQRHVKSGRVVIDWAMRYGKPSIASRLQALQEAGCNRLLVIPLYPQYAAATTATVQDEVCKWMLRRRWQPALRCAAPWHDHPHYIDALAKSVEAAHKGKGKERDHLLVSFHGIPQRYFDMGDPYHCHCMKTARLLREKLRWRGDKFHVAFQSRFGKEPWIKPYTDEVIEALAKAGTKHLAIMAPGFAADCLETLEELNMEGREEFMKHGGGDFTYIPCLNDSAPGMRLIEAITRENLAGWL